MSLTLPSRPYRLMLALLAATFLFLVYFLVYSPRPRSDDELYIMDTVSTLAVQPHPYLTQTAYLRGIQRTDVEPAQPLLAAPLYWLAYHTLWVGNVQALFLFNPVITAAIGLVFFFFALDLGYSTRTALVGMLLLGLGTILAPYAKTFLREPLTTLNLLGAAYCLNRWRTAFMNHQRRHWLWLAAGVGFTLLALLSKEAALIALPYFVALAFPNGDFTRRQRQVLIGIGIALVGLALGFTVSLIFFRQWFVILAGRYEVLTRLQEFADGLPHAWWGLAGYLLMPGRAIWFFSPILLLALTAPALLPHSRWRESWLLLGLAVWFGLSYAAVRRFTWYGGADWGSRYMVPLVPFLMLAALPLLDRLLNSTRLWPKIGLALLAMLSLLVQVGGTVVNVHDYYAAQAEATGLPFWKILWNVRWSQAVGSVLYIPQATPEIIWLNPAPDWPVLLAIITGVALTGTGLVWLYRRNDLTRRAALIGSAGGVALAAGIALFGLWRAFDSPYYMGDRADLRQLSVYLGEQAGPHDNILLSSPTYIDYFANYHKGSQVWYALPPSPGETYSPDQPPTVVSNRVGDLITPDIEELVNAVLPYKLFYRPTSATWLVGDQASYLPWAVRPVEWYLSQYSFPGTTVDFANNLRVVQIAALYAPQTGNPPAQPLDVRFGDHIMLRGFDVVVDEEMGASLDALVSGDMVGISLLWETDAPLEVSYTSAVYFIDLGGGLALQVDHTPQNGFAPTTDWRPGQPVRDNFGFVIPPDLHPGQYAVWVVMYSWPSLERLIVEPEGTDHLILTTLTVR